MSLPRSEVKRRLEKQTQLLQGDYNELQSFYKSLENTAPKYLLKLISQAQESLQEARFKIRELVGAL